MGEQVTIVLPREEAEAVLKAITSVASDHGLWREITRSRTALRCVRVIACVQRNALEQQPSSQQRQVGRHEEVGDGGELGQSCGMGAAH